MIALPCPPIHDIKRVSVRSHTHLSHTEANLYVAGCFAYFTVLAIHGLTTCTRVWSDCPSSRQCKPKHALSFSSTECVVRFLLTYSEQHALLLPGRIPGYSRSDIQLLPSSSTKRAIWRVYYAATEAKGSIHSVAYSTFCDLWRTLLPSIIIMKPQTDLCWQCQQNSTAIARTSNSPEADKMTAINDALEHLRVVKMERAYYKSVCEECRASVHAHFVTNGKFTAPAPGCKIPCNTNPIKVHYSFDYAQQVTKSL